MSYPNALIGCGSSLRVIIMKFKSKARFHQSWRYTLEKSRAHPNRICNSPSVEECQKKKEKKEIKLFSTEKAPKSSPLSIVLLPHSAWEREVARASWP